MEDVVCDVSEVQENDMKVFPLGSQGGKILLIRQHGQYHALGTSCTHYGAPLQTGALGEGRVRCPWHGACFNIKTGDIEDYPGLNSLPSYQVLERVKILMNSSSCIAKFTELNERLEKLLGGDLPVYLPQVFNFYTQD